NQSPIEKHPSAEARCRVTIGKCHRHGAPRERCTVDPGKCRAAAFQLFPDDTSARLLHNRVAAMGEFCEQGRFAATRASGYHDKPAHLQSLSKIASGSSADTT